MHPTGFHRIEEALREWLHELDGKTHALWYAHAMKQGPNTQCATGFAVHQDTEDFDFIEHTLVVKLTPDQPHEQV